MTNTESARGMHSATEGPQGRRSTFCLVLGIMMGKKLNMPLDTQERCDHHGHSVV